MTEQREKKIKFPADLAREMVEFINARASVEKGNDPIATKLKYRVDQFMADEVFG